MLRFASKFRPSYTYKSAYSNRQFLSHSLIRNFCQTNRVNPDPAFDLPVDDPVKTSDLTIGVPAETFDGENRVAISPTAVKLLVKKGFNVQIEVMINIKKNELICISKKVFKFYLTDPSNFEEKFLRTRIRNYLDKFKLDGLDINKIKLTLSNLQLANESINFYKEKSIKNHVRYLQRNACFVSYGLFNYESEEVIFRTINDIISKISDGYYPPRGKDVKNLITRMKSKKFKKSTLGGCIIEKTYNILIFRKEFEA